MASSKRSTTIPGSTTAPRAAALMGLLLSFAAGTTTALAQNSAQPPQEEASQQVRVDDAMTVDLHVKDEDLANVLEMLSIQSQKNIIASKDVQARVTANLYGVTFYEALDAILNVNGYGFIEEGNFIKIYTLDELQKIQQAQRLKVSQVIGLNFVNAVDAAEFVKPLLSSEGQIKVNGKVATFSAGDQPIGGEEYVGNSMLVVFDFEENVEQVQEMIRQIDTKPAQVLIEATILQTQLNEANALGVDFSLVADMSFNQFTGNPLNAVTALLGGSNASGVAPANDRGASAVSTSIGNVGGAGGVKVGVVSNDVAVFIRALDEVTDTTVLSNPKILTLNRMASRVLVGRKVGYLNTTSTDTATTQSVEFLDTGTSLSVRPFVTNDGYVRMELAPKVAEAAIREINDATGAAVTIPDEITNELTTNVLVRDGQTIVLGGLFREATTNTRRQVPVLGDIPFIGNAFRGRDDNTNRNEIIFLITPTIVNDEAISDAGLRGREYIDRVVAGAREGTLFFSRDKLTNQLNVEADRLLREGKNEEALYRIERSLALNTHQPELIELRERLSGRKSPHTNRSFLDRIINKEANDSLLQAQAEQQAAADPGASFWNDNTDNTFAQEATLAQENAPSFSSEQATYDQQSQSFAQDNLANETSTPDASTFTQQGLPVQPQATAALPAPGADLGVSQLPEDFLYSSDIAGSWIGPSPFSANYTRWTDYYNALTAHLIQQQQNSLPQGQQNTVTSVDPSKQ